ncbi:potassium channel family protein [Natranaerofaba carboxydovora]|uniref:potassium channel family protein n=1 Tax=Natranaerofaba carboxydovora TaxID=2742683 RepID=UPI001F140724|nr:potassium channel protein [Natranaerofaba carboxydovora]UMZ73714.1 Glutathione-regulated potassium-efflux system protein KefC [Natranaerofaba carboxydovora]
MKLIKNLFPNKNSKSNNELLVGFNKVTDYSMWLLFRVFFIGLFLIILLIPIVRYLMATFEGREITTGQAIVFIMQTLTTTGYGELLPFDSYPMIALSIFLMVSGVFIIFMIAGTLMATLIEKRITPKAPNHTEITGHVVFTAFNSSVAQTIKLLERNNIPYVVASEEQSDAVTLMRKGINTICVNPRYDEGLKNLNIEKARLVVVTNDDTVNINITLGISTMSNTPVLAMMENKTRAELAYNAGAKHVVSLEETLGQQLVDLILANASPTEFLKLINVEVSTDIIKQLKPSIIHIGSHDKFNKQTIGDIRIRSATGATVVAIWNEDGTVTAPSAKTILDNSTLIVLGPQDNVDHLATFMGGPGPGGHVVLVGAGRVGQEAGKMLNYAGIYPDVIDIKERPLYFKGNLITGDSTKTSVLQKAKIEEADTLILTINDDSINIFTALNCKKLNPNIDIVSRAVSTDVVDRLHQAGVNHVLSETIMGFQLLQVAMVDMGVLPKLSNYLIREIKWNREPTKLRDLTERNKVDAKIICIVRENKVLEPSAELALNKNDLIVALGSFEEIKELADLCY